MKQFSSNLQNKINFLMSKSRSSQLGSLSFTSKLLLAPMASICNAPFRLLMEDLGAGGTVSELISAHGINYKNDHTLQMLRIDQREKNVGIQLFGEGEDSLANAAQVAESYGAKWIDLNMGCPVKKVVTKGAGAALSRDLNHLGKILKKMKSAIKVPLTIKIRLGWDDHEKNADEIIKMAKDSGVEFVAIHGRTRAQQYTGHADWPFLETLCLNSRLPLIGNGDLHTPSVVCDRLAETSFDALMLARGPLRNPFLFLEGLTNDSDFYFNASDTWEVIERLHYYNNEFFSDERVTSIQLRKFMAWYAAGLPNAVSLRQKVFSSMPIEDCLKHAEDYFLHLGSTKKSLQMENSTMTSGHG